MSQCTCTTDKEITCIVHPTAMRVECYWNLHKGGWSVRVLDRKHPSYNRVIAVVDKLWIHEPAYVVQPAGRDKVRKEKRKNVHAYVRGTYHPFFEEVGSDPVGVTYNPYVNDTFIKREDGEPVSHSDVAFLYTDEEGKGKVQAYWESSSEELPEV